MREPRTVSLACSRPVREKLEAVSPAFANALVRTEVGTGSEDGVEWDSNHDS